jgi:YedE family putative selenium metabolism protein
VNVIKRNWGLIATGIVVGLVAIILAIHGNPGNMQFCIACFFRDIAGAIGLHRAAPVQYIRPEVIGIVIGALAISLVRREFASKGGSSPLTRFVLAICVMIGALIFLGCPLRMVLRMAGGDLNALIGLVGFAGGILTGIFFLNKGFSLRRSHDQPLAESLLTPAINILLLVALIAAPAFIFFSEAGPGSMHAPIWMALLAGLAVGGIAHWSRLCFVGGIRDAIMFKDFKMLLPFVVILAVVFVGNLVTGGFNLALDGQPVAHNEWIWNIAGLYLVGFGSVLLGGCPLRQVVMAGSGNSDAGIAVLGLLIGSAIVHNFDLASSAAGTTANGRIAFVLCVIVMLLIAIVNTKKSAG